jgi:hypothetical protein
MKQMKTLFILMMIACSFGKAWALSELAQYAEKQEQLIQASIKQEKVPLRRQQTEFLYRQSYASRLQKERQIWLRSGKLTTPKVETLRAERKALLEQLEALDQKIAEASLEAPEMIELKAIEEANNNRIEALRKSIMPDLVQPTTPDAEH